MGRLPRGIERETEDRPTAVTGHHPVVVINAGPPIREMIRLVLEDAGYRAVACDGVDQAHQLVKDARPDLAIVDVWMLGAPDWQLLDTLKGDPATATIPVLVCTAAAGEIRSGEARLRAWGCDVLEMPFDIDELLHKVGRLSAPTLEGAVAGDRAGLLVQ